MRTDRQFGGMDGSGGVHQAVPSRVTASVNRGVRARLPEALCPRSYRFWSASPVWRLWPAGSPRTAGAARA